MFPVLAVKTCPGPTGAATSVTMVCFPILLATGLLSLQTDVGR